MHNISIQPHQLRRVSIYLHNIHVHLESCHSLQWYHCLFVWHFAIPGSRSALRCSPIFDESGTVENLQTFCVFVVKVFHFLWATKCRSSPKIWFRRFQVIERFEIDQRVFQLPQFCWKGIYLHIVLDCLIKEPPTPQFLKDIVVTVDQVLMNKKDV